MVDVVAERSGNVLAHTATITATATAITTTRRTSARAAGGGLRVDAARQLNRAEVATKGALALAGAGSRQGR